MFMFVVILWVISFLFSFGIAGIIFIFMRNAAKKPWNIKVNNDYRPKISVLVPTYNEGDIIRFKLENLTKVKYPKDFMQIIVVDSNSDDQTANIVKDFITHNPGWKIQVLIEEERRGKSAALNFALKNCDGEIVIVSDADCFWPSDILEKALPFLVDPSVGAISGPKVLLNLGQSWVTKFEGAYLDLMNLMKLGESKTGSTLLFEGGFSAYKKNTLTSFDPYDTGSDDCGTVIKLVENGYRTLLIPEARFYSSFPMNWKGKSAMKVRRGNQIVRVSWRYLRLLLKGCVKGSKKMIVRGFLLYIVSPLMFALFVVTTILLLLNFPYLAILFLVFLIPKIRVHLFEALQNYLLLLLSMINVVFNKKFVVWNKPEDRAFIQDKVLKELNLI